MSTAADYIVEVRDRNFARLGQIAPEFLDLKFVEVLRSVGAWELKLPADHPLLPALKTKGAGIIVTHIPSGRVFSGRMTSPVLSQDAEDPVGTWTISGVDDNVVAATRTVFPDPANLASAQTAAYWVTSGPGETVMKNAVKLNAGSSAIASRKYSWLSVAPDVGRGGTVSASARFDKLGDLLASLGVASGLGWRFTQVGAGVTFEVYPTADKSAMIRLDIRNGGLSDTELGYSAPTATTALVLGQGEGADRTVRIVTSSAATAEAALWGLQWEVAKDQRNTDVVAELDQAGQEILTEQGSTVHSLKVTPSDAPNQRLGVDWGLGDLISVIIDGTQATAVVTEISTSISYAGVIQQATVGDPVGFDWEARVGSKLKEQGERIGDLERLVDTGVTWAAVKTRPEWLTGSAKVLSTEDLNTIRDSGFYQQTSNANATAARNYPAVYAGALEVVSQGIFTMQRYTLYQTPTGTARGIYVRTYYNGTWWPWSEPMGIDVPVKAHVHAAADITSGTIAAARLPAVSSSAAGIIELATQTEVNAGTDAVRAVTPATLRNSANIPFRMAAGTTAVTSSIAAGAGVTVTITFPSGAFSVPPILSPAPGGSARLSFAILSVTATSATVRLDNWSGASATGVTALNWVAVQMASGSASG